MASAVLVLGFGIFETLNTVFLFLTLSLRGASKKRFLSHSTALNYSDQHFAFSLFYFGRKSCGHSKVGRRGKGVRNSFVLLLTSVSVLTLRNTSVGLLLPVLRCWTD